MGHKPLEAEEKTKVPRRKCSHWELEFSSFSPGPIKCVLFLPHTQLKGTWKGKQSDCPSVCGPSPGPAARCDATETVSIVTAAAAAVLARKISWLNNGTLSIREWNTKNRKQLENFFNAFGAKRSLIWSHHFEMQPRQRRQRQRQPIGNYASSGNYWFGP